MKIRQSLKSSVIIKNHFKKATKNGLLSNQAFWGLVKPFLSNKGALVGSDISIVKNGTIITDDQDLSEIFNEYYVNIVENTIGKKPCGVADTTDIDDDRHLYINKAGKRLSN